MLVQIIPFILFFVARSATASFTRAAANGNDLIQPRGNTPCYSPSPRPVDKDDSYTWGQACPNEKLEHMVIHHSVRFPRPETKTPSIAYYNLETGEQLGDGTWSVHNRQDLLRQKQMAVCLSGSRGVDIRSDDNDAKTICWSRTFCGVMHAELESMKHDTCFVRLPVPSQELARAAVDASLVSVYHWDPPVDLRRGILPVKQMSYNTRPDRCKNEGDKFQKSTVASATNRRIFRLPLEL
ncbi:hypothetical protein BKA62DRAFT_711961 [Auriculariales sp. MPI-PUGE-AT-0066]|nr:hypothetical protein BKA62DRAFT_711961 [Auriculariales sp. MPI-PUGE-AT-0066]